MTEQDILEEAAERGTKAGESAASWFWDFGRMSDRDFADLKRQWKKDKHRVISRIEDDNGTPNFVSGEWAGESINELMGDLIEAAEEEGLEDFEDEIVSAYEDAAQDAYWTEVWREAELHLEEDEEEEDDDEEEED